MSKISYEGSFPFLISPFLKVFISQIFNLIVTCEVYSKSEEVYSEVKAHRYMHYKEPEFRINPKGISGIIEWLNQILYDIDNIVLGVDPKTLKLMDDFRELIREFILFVFVFRIILYILGIFLIISTFR